jgi:hypothetical protein
MANVVAAIAGLLAFGALWCVGRAAHVFRTGLPAASTVSDSTYTEALQDQDAPFGHGWYTQGRPGLRFIHDQVDFLDKEGQRRRVEVARWVTRRYRPASAYVVWYDRRSPNRATANGPSYWFGFAAILVAMLIGLAVGVAQIGRERAARSVASASIANHYRGE